MSDGSINAPSGLDERTAVAQSKVLPGRLEASDHIGYEQLPSSVPDAIDEESAHSSDRPVFSRLQSFTMRGSSWTTATASPTGVPVVPTSASTELTTEECDRVFTPGRTDTETQNDVPALSMGLVQRSSLSRNGSDGGKNSRVHPVLCNVVENSKDRRRSSERGISDASDRLSSFNDQGIASVVGKRLSLHRIKIASRPNSVVAAAAVPANSQQPIDPSIHRMIYFRTKKELSDLFVLPPVSMWGRRFNRFVFVLILVGIADLAIKTCDGPNLGSTDPGYPYLPSEEDHEIYDGLFAGLFTLEFVGRIIQTENIRAFVHDPYMWLDLIGITPWYIIQILEAVGNDVDDHYVNLLRLLRTVRLALILRHYEQSKIMYLAIKASLRPLSITLFFLFTLVMILATAIFYAEPCYNVETCTFTDIFNTAYFVMLTVATVGYGGQLPSLQNPGSMILTMLAMILGQIYFSMPVAIIGNNFQLTHDNFQLDKKKKARYLDASLSPFDCQNLHSHARRLCDIQYHLLRAWPVVHNHIYGIARTNTRSSQSMTMDRIESEADRQTKVKDGINRLLEVHAEAVVLLQVFIPHRRRSFRINPDTHSQGMLGNMYAKAKRAMAKAKVKSGYQSAVVDPRTASRTLRGRIWLLLEVPDSSRLATLVNQAMVAFALVSVMLFFTESLQELAGSGVETNGCRSVVKSYCRTTGFGLKDPACFLRLDNNASDFTEKLDFSCDAVAESPICYGNGLNFGSLDTAALPCKDAFLRAGADYVCYRQQCRESLNMIFDMGPYWIYFEWFFGMIFTVELALRFYIAQDRKQFWKNFYVIFDVVAILPFFVEFFELFLGHIQPDYAIVATSPSFLSVIRVLKIMRILKLTRHFRGTKVLASTAVKVWKPLVIPLFFLFTGCIIAGAMFYEIERGKECFVGEECWWWGKDVLTPELATGLPIGKRVLIQDKVKSIIIDMIHSSWLSYTTLTSVGYGDLTARTSIGKFFDVFVIIVATIYSAMPLSLVGTQFYSLYEKHMERMVVKQGGSSVSWRTRTTITIVTQYKQAAKHPSARKQDVFALSDEHLIIAREFENMRRTILNLQRTLEAASTSSFDAAQRTSSVAKGSKASTTSRRSMTATMKNPARVDACIEQKSFAIMDTLLHFSEVVEKLQEAPVDFEAFEDIENDLHANLFPNTHSPRPMTDLPDPERLDTFQ